MARVNHPSGIPNAYETDRNDDGIVFPEATADGLNVFVVGMDLNDMQRLQKSRVKRVAEMVARDGDIQSGCQIIVERDEEPATTLTLTLDAGTIYIDGTVRPVSPRVLTDVPGEGAVIVGVRLVATPVDDQDDPSLVGPLAGSDAEGEPIGLRIVETISWSLETAEEPGVFFAVYTLLDGTPLDQTAPELSGVGQIIAAYDYGAKGHYVVSGCEIRALGRVDGVQTLSIGAGEANILGWKRVRENAIPFSYEELPDLEEIDIEPHTYTAVSLANNTVTVNRPPIASVDEVIVTKQKTVDIVRGLTTGGSDALPDSSIQAIVSIVQGGTTYDPAHYTLSGANVSWAPAGSEPAASSTYSVTYRYFEAQAPVSVSDTQIVVAGGINGQPVFVSYRSKLPRIDVVCMDIEGRPVLVRGLSTRVNAQLPQVPSSLLKLATIYNDWMPPAPYLPRIVNDGARTLTVEYQRRLEGALIKLLDYVDRMEMERDTLSREPVSKRGIFTDAFVDDFRRDQGESQTLAIVDGGLCLAIDRVAIVQLTDTWETLPFTEQVIIRQDLRTSGLKINPYANFTAMPAGLSLAPHIDLFEVDESVWTSPETRTFQAPPGNPGGSTTIIEEVFTATRRATTMRSRLVEYTIEGFGAGEKIEAFTMNGRPVQMVHGGVDVALSAVPAADSNGSIVSNFRVPADMPTGTRVVRVTGLAGSFARALYVGEGTVNVRTLRRVTLVARAAPPPPAPNRPPPGGNWTNPNINDPDGDGFTESTSDDPDPLAQTFALPNLQGRMVVGANFWVHAIGDRSNGVRVQLVTVANGIPTTEVLAEDFISMVPTSIQPGSMIQARFRTPVYCEPGRLYAFVIMTDDDSHALKVARLGDVINLPGGRQARVGAQPYTNGVLLASADRRTWTPIQEADLAFQVVAADFSATTRTVDLWTGAFDRVSDIVVRAGIDIPEPGASVVFELVRASGAVVRFSAGQQLPFDEYIGPTGSPETVTLRAVLSGTALVSPVLFPGAILITGRIRETGDYVSKVFPMGTSVTVRSIMQRLLPTGSTLTVQVDATDDSWQSMPLTDAGVDLGNGWTEPVYSRTSHVAANGGRVKVTLTGGPAARPFLRRLRAYSI